MGYTHYFYRKEKLDASQFKAFTEDVRKILANTDVPLSRYDGNDGSPEITDHSIVFNGVGADSHETFLINREFDEPFRQPNEKGFLFAFCKTARKPYDEVVVACLIAAKYHFGDDIDVSSDGNAAEWEEGAALYKKATGRIPVVPIDGV